MKNTTSKRLLTWLLIISPVWWTSGCYTMEEFEKPSDAGNHDIEVTTKSNTCYTFHEWTADSLGTIRGSATWKNPSRSFFSFSAERMHLDGQCSVPKDSIASISYEHLDVPSTVLAGIGILAGALVVVFIILFDIHALPVF